MLANLAKVPSVKPNGVLCCFQEKRCFESLRGRFEKAFAAQ